MSLPVDPHQYTIKKAVSCCGVGLHSGRTVNLTLRPSGIDEGIRFFRTDLENKKPIHAHMDKVVDTRLATTIGEEGRTVSTTEHLLAAVRGYGIDNLDVEIDSPEVPIMDGSAGPFFKLLAASGKRRQSGFRKILRITDEVCHRDEDRRISIRPHNGFKVSGEIDFDDELIKSQKYSINLYADRFVRELSRARTFGYVEQVEELWANGLALGGTLDSVIAIHWNRKSVLNEDGLRYENEFIRHKVLDLIGDIALLGCPVLGHVEAYKAGHAQHLGLMLAIAEHPECWEIVEMRADGGFGILDHMVEKTREAGARIMPFLSPHSPAVISA